MSALSATLLLTACGSAPMAALPDSSAFGSTAPQATTPVPHLPPGVNVVSLSLTPASASVAVGSTQQFTPTIKLSNGQTVYDPSLVQWAVSDPYSGTIDSNGLFTPNAQRLTSVQVDLDGMTAAATVSIVPAVYSWQQVSSPTTQSLYAGKILSHNEAWAVGANGTVLHFLGGQWQPYQSYGNGVDPSVALRAIS
ncbi:MAG: Ig-like domain-containing protein, partial [Cyanobacteria bacterium REEB65]|nr:Ig-like domain-containing protein [Cyanobacteria bacterium REEB65]